MDLQQVELIVGELVVFQTVANQVGVPESIFYGDSFSLIYLQAGLHEAQSVLFYLAQVPHLDRLCSLHYRQLDPLELRVLLEVLALLSGDVSHQFGYYVKLVYLVVSWKHGLPVHQLPDHAADGPHVGRLAVGLTNQQLWTTIPASGHIVGEVVLFLGQKACEAEVADLEY